MLTEKRREYYRKYRKLHPETSEHVRIRHLKEKFGLTREGYLELLNKQGGVCAICKQPETATRNGKVKELQVDHNHRTGEVRGLLCSACNIALGKFQDSTQIIADAYRYLIGYSELPSNPWWYPSTTFWSDEPSSYFEPKAEPEPAVV